MALGLMVVMAIWLGVVLMFGYRPLSLGMTYDETVMVAGLAILIVCTIGYIVERALEQRTAKQQLLREFQEAVSRLDEQVTQLNGLCATSAELSGCLDVDRIAGLAVDAVVGLLRAPSAALLLFDEETGYPVYARTSDGAREASVRGPRIAWPDYISPEGGHIADLDGQVRAWNVDPTRACAALRLANGLAGVLAARRDGGFRQHEQSALSLLASMAAKAMESAQHHAELRESYMATVRSLVYSLDARDNYTATHSQRVASLALRMAEYLALPEAALRDIETFGPLHDVGKIGIRDGILMKPGPLTDDEWAVCREHAIIGERILRPLKPSREALGMVRNHHESWDGTGYPDGLAGEMIPLLARVVQVADCYDAMVAERPHRRSISDEEVRVEFIMNRGRRYDPLAVDALLAVLDESRTPEPAYAGGTIDQRALV
jgi:hypothetical protein